MFNFFAATYEEKASPTNLCVSFENNIQTCLPDDYDSELFIQKLEECFVKGDKCE